MDLDLGKATVAKLSKIGIEKVNLVGGEPLLHPRIFDFCSICRDHGMTVSVTSNGSLLDEERVQKLRDNVDWIGISVDSRFNEIEQQLGRGNGKHVTNAIRAADLVHDAGIRLKINTTVTKLNYRENLRGLIHRLRPDRWKVFQMLHIRGQNDECVSSLAITEKEFNRFTYHHRNVRLPNGTSPVFERSADMANSYFLIAPSGNIVSNSGGGYFEIPLDYVSEYGFDYILDEKKYLERGGLYQWNRVI